MKRKMRCLTLTNTIFKITEIIYRFVALNVIWLFFVLIGFGILGFMPATVALFSVIRKQLMGEKGLSVFKVFLNFYKKEFIRSNILGVVFLIIFYIIYVNFSFVSFYFEEQIHFFIYIVILFVAIIAVMTFVNMFSIMAHFEFKMFQYIKVAAQMVFFRPLNTLMQLMWLVAYYILAIQSPTVFIVLGASILSFILMTINYRTFTKYASP